MKSYGLLTSEAIQQLTSNAGLVDALSPPAQVTAFSMFEAISGEVGQDLTSSVVKSLPPEVADAASATAMMTLKFVLTSVSSGDVGAAAVELAQTALNYIPVFGQIINVMIGLFTEAEADKGGIGPASSNKAERAAWCRDMGYAAPEGSGPNLQVMPCDLFGPPSQYELYPKSSLGQALKCIAEPDSIQFPVKGGAGGDSGVFTDIATVRKMAASVEKVLPGDSNPMKWAFNPKLGVPKDVQKLMKTLRLAIGAMQGKLETDGGVALMLTYTDVLRWIWESGWMGGDPQKPLDSSYYFNFIMDVDNDLLHDEVKTKGETCYTHDKRAGQGALGLIQGWQQTLHPYAQFSNPDEIALAQGELVGRVQGMLDRNNRVALLEAALKGTLRRDLDNFGKPNVMDLFNPKTKAGLLGNIR